MGFAGSVSTTCASGSLAYRRQSLPRSPREWRADHGALSGSNPMSGEAPMTKTKTQPNNRNRRCAIEMLEICTKTAASSPIANPRRTEDRPKS